jgi:hypothetical protein
MTSQQPERKIWQPPTRSCQQPVSNQIGMLYLCEAPQYHAGPCMSYSVKTSVTARQAWQEANPDVADATEADPFT